MAYDAERVMKGIKNLLQAELPGALDAVEALWQSEDPYALPDPATWHEGFKAYILEVPSDEFPFVSILVPNRKPVTKQAGRWGQQDVVHEAGVHCFVVADTQENVSKLAHRYAEALTRVFQSQRVIAGHGQTNYEPEVAISEVVRHPKGGVTGDLFDAADTDYIRVVVVTLDLG